MVWMISERPPAYVWCFTQNGHMLTHLPPATMAAILADDIVWSILSSESDRVPIQISRKFVAKGPIDKNRTLV